MDVTFSERSGFFGSCEPPWRGTKEFCSNNEALSDHYSVKKGCSIKASLFKDWTCWQLPYGFCLLPDKGQVDYESWFHMSSSLRLSWWTQMASAPFLLFSIKNWDWDVAFMKRPWMHHLWTTDRHDQMCSLRSRIDEWFFLVCHFSTPKLSYAARLSA